MRYDHNIVARTDSAIDDGTDSVNIRVEVLWGIAVGDRGELRRVDSIAGSFKFRYDEGKAVRLVPGTWEEHKLGF